jgi:hypothetical protein
MRSSQRDGADHSGGTSELVRRDRSRPGRVRVLVVALASGAIALSLVGTLVLVLGNPSSARTRGATSDYPDRGHHSTTPLQTSHSFGTPIPTTVASVLNRPPEIVGIQMSVDRAAFACGGADTQYTFTATIHVVASPTGFIIDGAFSGTGPASALVSASPSGWVQAYQVPPRATAITATFQLRIDPTAADGTYGVQFAATDPNHHPTFSNVATVTKHCSV